MENRTLFLLIALLFLAPPTFVLKAFAQQSTNVSAHIEPSWTDGGNARFKVSFLKPDGTVQVHIDYNVIVTSKDGKVIFDAAKNLGTSQPLLHTAEGVVTIPQEPDSPIHLDNGDYQVNATIYGVVFNPVTPTSNVLPITVTPEFPTQIGAAIAAAGLMGAAVVISRLVVARKNSE